MWGLCLSGLTTGSHALSCFLLQYGSCYESCDLGNSNLGQLPFTSHVMMGFCLCAGPYTVTNLRKDRALNPRDTVALHRCIQCTLVLRLHKVIFSFFWWCCIFKMQVLCGSRCMVGSWAWKRLRGPVVAGSPGPYAKMPVVADAQDELRAPCQSTQQHMFQSGGLVVGRRARSARSP